MGDTMVETLAVVKQTNIVFDNPRNDSINLIDGHLVLSGFKNYTLENIVVNSYTYSSNLLSRVAIMVKYGCF